MAFSSSLSNASSVVPQCSPSGLASTQYPSSVNQATSDHPHSKQLGKCGHSYVSLQSFFCYPKSHTASASREDILRQSSQPSSAPRRSIPYKPDLSYLKQGSPTSFASRLAESREEDAPQETRKAAELAHTLPPTSEQKNDAHARKTRVDELTAQRRAARLAREEAMKQQTSENLQKRPMADTSQETSVDLRKRITELTAKRRAERLAREDTTKQMPVGLRRITSDTHNPTRRQGQQFEGTNVAFEQRSYTSGSSDRQQPSRGGSRVRGGMRGGGNGMQRGGTVSPRGALFQARLQTSISTQDEGGDPTEDITLDILEKGGDDKEPAEFTSADISFAILDDVFGTPAPAKFATTTESQPSFLEERNLWVRETYGGDYVRFGPQIKIDSAVSRSPFGSIDHAQAILAKRGDVAIGPRNQALALMTSTMSQSTGTRAVRST